MKPYLLTATIILISEMAFSQISFSPNSLPHTTDGTYLMGGGVAVFDFDNDGDEDIYFASGYGRDQLYANDGSGTFIEVGLAAGLNVTTGINTFGVIAGDIENDGDKDIFLTVWMNDDTSGAEILQPNMLLRNDGGVFTDISATAGIIDSAHSTSATFIDYNQDGFLDIYVGNYVEEEEPLLDSVGTLIGYASTCFQNFLYVNDGMGSFTESAAMLGANSAGCALAVASTDYNNDGTIDLMIANDFGYWLTPNELLDNNLSSFSDVSTSTGADVGMYGMGIAVGDYDEDLDLDYYATNIGPNVFLENNLGSFTDIAAAQSMLNDSIAGLLTTGWSAFFFDADNDTYLDLFVANGHVPTPPNFDETYISDPNVLYQNNASFSYSDVSYSANVADSSMTHGAAYGDFNNDGLLDFVVANTDTIVASDFNSKVYMNNSPSQNYLKIELEGIVSNRDGFGSKVFCYAGGRAFMREVDGGSGHASHNSSIVHFGLGAISSIDSIVVRWPSGIIDVVNANVNNSIQVIEGIGTELSELETIIQIYPNPVHDKIYIRSSQPVGNCSFEIFSMDGRLVKKWSGSGLSNSFDISDLEPGNYLLSVNTIKLNSSLKFIKH